LQGGVAARYPEVFLQVDPAEGEMPHRRLGGDRERIRDASGAFDRADQWLAGGSVGYPPHVVDRLDLGNADAVCQRGNRVQIRFSERGSSGVDSYPGGMVPESAGDVVACGRLVFRRDRVLEVEDHRVRARVEDLAEQLLAVPGGEQIAAVHYNTPFALSAATHSGSSPSDSE
jgi:hypothetical protein